MSEVPLLNTDLCLCVYFHWDPEDGIQIEQTFIFYSKAPLLSRAPAFFSSWVIHLTVLVLPPPCDDSSQWLLLSCMFCQSFIPDDFLLLTWTATFSVVWWRGWNSQELGFSFWIKTWYEAASWWLWCFLPSEGLTGKAQCTSASNVHFQFLCFMALGLSLACAPSTLSATRKNSESEPSGGFSS